MKRIHSIVDFQSNYIRYKMIGTLQAICYYLIELLTPPEIKQIRFITRECVSKYCYQLVTKMVTPFQDKMWFHNKTCHKNRKKDGHA